MGVFVVGNRVSLSREKQVGKDTEMTPLDRYLSDAAIAGQIRLLQFTASEQKKVLAVLVTMRALWLK